VIPAPSLAGQPFNAQAMFGLAVPLPPRQAAFIAAIVESLAEFDGIPITDQLAERIDRRVNALQTIVSELVPP
jgi:hypothetical protein